VTKSLRLLPALGAVLFALVGLAACGGGLPGDAVVQVGGTSITKAAFNHWMQVASASTAASGGKVVVPEPPSYSACIAHLAATAPKPAKGQKAPTTAQLKTQCEQQYKSLQQQVLGFLISSEWVIGEASSLGVKLTDAEVRKQFLKIKDQQFPKPAEFKKFLSTSGQTVSDLLLRIKAVSLLPQKIEAKIVKDKGKVTDAQITKYYNTNKSRFGTPEKRSVQIILTKTEAAAKSAKKEVQSGKSFAGVAKKVSIDPTSKAKGGVLSGVIKGQEEKTLDAAIFSAAKNVLSGPVKTPFGFYVFEVKSITAGKQQPLSKVKSSIKQQLTATQQQKALTDFVKAFKKKWTAKTDCRAAYLVADCKQYKAPKANSKPTSPSTGSTK
jgi:foldase protein PrsA